MNVHYANPYTPPRPVFPVQRDCERAACKALGIQCQERRASMPCKESK